MKLAKIALMTAAFAASGLVPQIGSATIAYGAVVTGEVTATPANHEIEVAHHLYHVKANSAADKALSGFYAGQNVDLALDGPLTSNSSEVVSIAPHTGS